MIERTEQHLITKIKNSSLVWVYKELNKRMDSNKFKNYLKRLSTLTLLLAAEDKLSWSGISPSSTSDVLFTNALNFSLPVDIISKT